MKPGLASGEANAIVAVGYNRTLASDWFREAWARLSTDGHA